MKKETKTPTVAVKEEPKPANGTYKHDDLADMKLREIRKLIRKHKLGRGLAIKLHSREQLIESLVNHTPLSGRGGQPEVLPATGKVAPTVVSASTMKVLVPDVDKAYKINKEDNEMLACVLKRSETSPQNVAIVGPHGCGKTELVIQHAARNGRPLLIMDCANIREQRDWFGYKGASGGTTYWNESQFVRAVTAGEHYILLDELNRTSDSIRNTLFPLLDFRRHTYLEEKGDVIRVGPKTIFFCTLNEGMGYTGTSSLDLAISDRFSRRIEVHYLDPDEEEDVIIKKTGIDKEKAKLLVDLANTIRKKAIGFGATLSKSISTRQLLSAAEDFQEIGRRSLDYNIVNHFNADAGTESERAQVLQMVNGKFGT